MLVNFVTNKINFYLLNRIMKKGHKHKKAHKHKEH